MADRRTRPLSAEPVLAQGCRTSYRVAESRGAHPFSRHAQIVEPCAGLPFRAATRLSSCPQASPLLIGPKRRGPLLLTASTLRKEVARRSYPESNSVQALPFGCPPPQH